ncbi:hypothetical protein NQ317_018443 [Molorchus minor]|uniref:RNase H type-1 domain-containing protein n=1 Tax=Molorchus minor TaxID=1323400 RepID=A0ABQ9JF23_9CUCU|nr:hypothetical protein NQ317_018443 [Molorchus minor]
MLNVLYSEYGCRVSILTPYKIVSVSIFNVVSSLRLYVINFYLIEWVMQEGENYPILKSLEFWHASEAAEKGRTIQIFSDSQAALLLISLLIESSNVKSRLVLECKKTLNDLASRNKVIFTWVPGHSGVRGNEEAVGLAREGSAMYPIGLELIPGVPPST